MATWRSGPWCLALGSGLALALTAAPGCAQPDEHPVSLVTFDDAQAFATWAARKAGRAVTLPTEAQWEYACRAGTTSRFCGADAEAELGSVAWFKANAGNGTRPVGQKK